MPDVYDANTWPQHALPKLMWQTRLFGPLRDKVKVNMVTGRVTWTDVDEMRKFAREIGDTANSGVAAHSASSPDGTAVPSAIEVRLTQLLELSKKGLISGQDFEKRKDEILNEV